MLKVLTKNAIKCNSCNDIIESTHRHDFKWCSCNSCAVDGGLAYQKRCAKAEDSYTEMCEYREATREEKEQYFKDHIDDYLCLYNDCELDIIIDKIMLMNE